MIWLTWSLKTLLFALVPKISPLDSSLEPVPQPSTLNTVLMAVAEYEQLFDIWTSNSRTLLLLATCNEFPLAPMSPIDLGPH